MANHTVKLGVAHREPETDVSAFDFASHIVVAVIVHLRLWWNWSHCKPTTVLCYDLSRELGRALTVALLEAERFAVEGQTQVQARLVADSTCGCA
jgi:hypothetical protein